jgi:hypothetical protein
MRCFFDLVKADRSILDEEGIEIVNLDELRVQVAQAVQRVGQTRASLAKDWEGWRLEVSDPSHVVLFSIDLDRFKAPHKFL